MDGQMEGQMDIYPCVLQDIGPLGPLPKKDGCMEICPCVLQDIGPLGPLPCSYPLSFPISKNSLCLSSEQVKSSSQHQSEIGPKN